MTSYWCWHLIRVVMPPPPSPPFARLYGDDLISDTEVQRVMAMDESLIQDFLKERAAEVQHASKVIANTIIDEKNKTGALIEILFELLYSCCVPAMLLTGSGSFFNFSLILQQLNLVTPETYIFF